MNLCRRDRDIIRKLSTPCVVVVIRIHDLFLHHVPVPFLERRGKKYRIVEQRHMHQAARRAFIRDC